MERLQWWLENFRSVIKEKSNCNFYFSFASEPDAGMYDALLNGFSHFDMALDDWMCWINSDDTFSFGAFSLISKLDKNPKLDISWVTGCAATRKDGMQVTQKNSYLSSDLIKFGLCDGIAWDFVQQEGTFFKKKAWDYCNPEKSIRPFKYAGDWNLWRLMANKFSLYQYEYPLGFFHVTPGQLSAKHRNSYYAEIYATVSKKTMLSEAKLLLDKQIVCIYIRNVNSDVELFTLNIDDAYRTKIEKYNQ